MSLLATVNGRGTLAARPAAAAANEGYIYSASDGALYRSNGTSWDTIGGSGIADQGTFTYLDGTVAAAPATPAAGKLRLYAKTGKVLAVKDDAGVETVLGAGGGGTTIGYPSLKPASPTDDFAAALSGWTAVATSGAFAIGSCHGQAIDGSHLWMSWFATNGFIYQAASNVDQEWIVGGLTANMRQSDQFYGIALLDTANDGVGLIYHSGDNTCAIISIAAGIYTGAPAASTTAINFGAHIGTPTKLWFRLTKVGTTWTGYVSLTGTAWEQSPAATMTKTVTVARKAIGSFGAAASAYYGQMTADWVHTV